MAKMGLSVNGIVVAKSEFKAKSGGVRKQIVVAMPGGSTNLTIEVTEERHKALAEMSPVEMVLSVSDFNGRLFFTERV